MEKVERWISDNYNEIMKITKLMFRKRKPIKDIEWEDVGHNVIEEFIKNKKAEKLIDDNEALKYISGMIHFNLYSYNTPNNYKEMKIDIVKKDIYSLKDIEWEDYDNDLDELVIKIEEILNEKNLDVKLWYNIKLFKMFIEHNNYSLISRETNIPRKSVSRAINKAREYIKNKIKE